MEEMMPNFIFAYHGGKMPDSPEEGQRVMAQWNQWYENMGSAIVDGGGPCGKSSTVKATGVESNGGVNPLSGYTVVSAANKDEAIEMARGCPILSDGSVEVAEVLEM
jgi:hypothetical protein